MAAQPRSKLGHETLFTKGGVTRAWTSPNRLLVVFVCIVFLTGGGARGDIASLMFLRPFAVAMLALGLLTLSRHHVSQFRWLFAFAGAALGLAVVHLVPLPASLWQSLPGREIIVEIDRAAGLDPIWRPLAMDPPAAQNAFWSLSVPFAALVLAVQLDAGAHRRVLVAVMCMGLLSAIMAVFQLLGDPRSGLYLYRITNNGSAVGLFANRNHQAVFLSSLLPLAAAWISTRPFYRSAPSSPSFKLPILGFLSLAVLLTVLILVTGSRAGMLTLAIAFPAAIWLIGPGGDGSPKATMGSVNRYRGRWTIGMALMFCAAVAITSYFGRNIALDRLFSTMPGEERRSDVAKVVLDLIETYAPFGSGLGSFQSVYRISEPDQILGPTYPNHVHNDFLEVAMTLGVPGLALVALAGIVAVTAGWRCLKAARESEAIILGRAAIVVLILLATASLWDYPLRVPSLQVVGVLAAVWLARSGFGGQRMRVTD